MKDTNEVKEADDYSLRVKILEKLLKLRAMYNEDDGNMVLFELTNAKVTNASFNAPAEFFEL